MNKTNNKLTPNVITVDIDKLSSMLKISRKEDLI